MIDPLIPRLVSDLLHEVAEGLQSAGTYLSAARRISAHNLSEGRSNAQAIDKASSEVARAQAALHQLRKHLTSKQACKTDTAGMLDGTDIVPPLIRRERSGKTHD